MFDEKELKFGGSCEMKKVKLFLCRIPCILLIYQFMDISEFQTKITFSTINSKCAK